MFGLGFGVVTLYYIMGIFLFMLALDFVKILSFLIWRKLCIMAILYYVVFSLGFWL